MELTKIVSRLRTWLHLRKWLSPREIFFFARFASTGEKLDHRFRLSEHNVSMLRKWKYVRCHFHRHLLAKKKADLSFPSLLFFLTVLFFLRKKEKRKPSRCEDSHRHLAKENYLYVKKCGRLTFFFSFIYINTYLTLLFFSYAIGVQLDFTWLLAVGFYYR